MLPTIRRIRAGALAALVVTTACGGGGRSYAAPVSPESAVEAFLAAVRANSLTAMGELWGTRRGPAVASMERDELEKRLTVMRAFLMHERHEVLPDNAAVLPSPEGERIVQVRLTRSGCTSVVPFTLVRYGNGWLVRSVDLEAAGNPRRRCAPPRN